MYNQIYSFYPQNVLYFSQFFSPSLQYDPFIYQLPTSYQNQFDVSCQYMSFPSNFHEVENKSTSNSSDNSFQQSQEILEKTHQKNGSKKKFSIFKYPKKNAESNIINQIFSFLSLKTKSESILQKIFEGSQQKIQNFYCILKLLKKKNKKYINRCYIKDLTFFEPNHIGHKIIQDIRNKGSKKVLTVEEFKKALRILVSYYLKSKCISTVITSRKLDKDTMKEHLHRKREVHQYFNNQMQILLDSQQQ